jgi:tryptophan synthase alpha chain
LEQAGASLIEIGIPFSDPLADGPTIQHSSDVAIKNGATLPRVLELVREARTKTSIPLILMGYINPILHYGIEKFIREAANAGVDGLIIPDVPPEECDELCALSKQYCMSNIFLIAPTTSDERIQHIDSLSTDFTYCVSVTGVTGARSSFGDSSGFEHFLSRVRANTKKPFVVGFGIKGKEQVQMISQFSDGVVIGSALLQAIADETSVDAAASRASEFLLTLK